jgi:hypothetical protein
MYNPVHGNHDAGAVVDLPDDEAERRIAAGYAAAVEQPRRRLAERVRRTKQPAKKPTKRSTKQPAKKPTESKPVEKMTVEELRDYAAEHDVDLGDATDQREILAAIEAAQDADE